MSRIDTILVLDFGGQYCHLIGRRIREHQVYSSIVSYDISSSEIATVNEGVRVKGVILSGGPLSVYEGNAPKCDPAILDRDLPVLGLCYGHQLIASICGGTVRSGRKKEFGVTYATVDRPLGVLNGLGPRERVWMSHGDTVFALPEEFEVLAHTENTPVAAFKHKEKPIWGLQWHPEVFHTEHGDQMLRNFVFRVCGCEANWVLKDVIESAVQEMKQTIGEEKAITALSGGIDSSVTTALAAKALGKQLTAVFVDHGFMREGEPESVARTFGPLAFNFISINARTRFFEKVRGVSDPERKRQIIGEEFIRVFEDVAREVGAKYLIQGTIYPDRIESGIRQFSEKIKSHHNVGGLPTEIGFDGIVEPLRDLYKDEVRKVAETLGLPEAIVWRQPFPGPGLAVRVMGEVTEKKIGIIKKADQIVTEEIQGHRLDDDLWQFFAVLTDTKSTGVKGDARAYGHTIAIRAVESREAMTAGFARLPYSVLERISTRITNELPSVTRVVYDITHKPPATIEWE